MFPSFTLFGKTIGLYPICSMVGLFVAAFVTYRLTRKIALAIEDIILILLVSVGGVVVGGHALYGITQAQVLVVNISQAKTIKQLFALLAYCFGGAVYYGGFLGIWFATKIYVTPKRFSNSVYIKDVIATVIPLFHCFGRVGCFLGGCCYGIESRFGFYTNSNTINPSINGVVRFPVSILEALCNLAIFFVLLYIIKKKKSDGYQFYYYLLMYPIVRFFDEFLRGDAVRGFLFGLSTSQWISIVLFVIASSALLIKKLKQQKTNIQEPSNT